MCENLKCLLGASVLGVAIVGATVVAQEPPRRPSGRPATEVPDRATEPTANRDAARGQFDNRDIATLVLNANRAEVDAAQLAEKQAQNQRVRQFAQQMVKDHTQFIRDLQQATGIAEPAGLEPADREAARPDSARPDSAPAARATDDAEAIARPASRRDETGWVGLLGEICRRKHQMCMQELEQKQGREFDAAYIGGQIGAHTEMLASLEVFATVADQQLRPVLDRGIETTREHLKHAKSLMQELDSPRQARAPQ